MAVSENGTCSYAGRGDCSPGGTQWHVSYPRTVLSLGPEPRRVIDVVCDTHLPYTCDRADDEAKITVKRYELVVPKAPPS